MLRKGLGRLSRQMSALSRRERWMALAWLPVIRLTGDLAKMTGYPVGQLWRLRHRPPSWRTRRGAGRL
jgi:hypothetical protein